MHVETWGHEEMMGAKIKDKRRRKSMAKILCSLVEMPGVAFSTAVGSASRQAATRIFSNDKLEVSDLLAGHSAQTIDRITGECSQGLVLIAQDTTALDFGRRKTIGLGYVNGTSARGLFCHSAFAMTPEGKPLGTLHIEAWARDDADYGKGAKRRDRSLVEKESFRWISTVRTVEDQLPVGQQALFIQDREADIFAFMEMPRRDTTHLLVRANQPRRVEVIAADSNAVPGAKSKPKNLFDAVNNGLVVGRKNVRLPRTQARAERDIELELTVVNVRILAPRREDVSGLPLTAWVVRACQVDPPDGQKPVEWVLITTMPISDFAGASQLVEYYTRRWGIERLHYTLKSGGCKVEALQFDDIHALKLGVAIYYVTAWRILYLMHMVRIDPDAPPEVALEPVEIEILEYIEKKPINTAGQAIICIAKLGGHEPYKNGPPPGVKTLWIGFRRLQDIEFGWQQAREYMAEKSAKKDVNQD